MHGLRAELPSRLAYERGYPRVEGLMTRVCETQILVGLPEIVGRELDQALEALLTLRKRVLKMTFVIRQGWQ
jgi:hypothetical protein